MLTAEDRSRAAELQSPIDMGGERISRRACSNSMASARPPETNCPLLTKQCKSVEELSSSEVPEIR